MTDITSFSGKYRFLSNFWPCQVTLDSVTYSSVEHAYQAAKTLNVDHRALIASFLTASEAKRYGRRLSLRRDWYDVRIPTMEFLLRQKFATDSLKRQLIATGDCTLIEGNTWGDRFWGQCNGTGLNELGKLLMKIRSELTC
jgi:ribA/ribD-fused uncharacterized protein